MRLNAGWTQDQLHYLIAHYPYEKAEDISKQIGKTIASITHKANNLGLKKDKEKFYPVRSAACSGIHSGNFKGYRRRTSKGYIVRYVPNHPNATKDGLVMEHRLIVEKSLGFVLPKEFDVHHINGIKDDNRLENLAIMTHLAHTQLHNKRDGKQKRGEDNPKYKKLDIEEIRKMQEQGFTVNEICKRVGIGRTKYFKEMKRAVLTNW